MNTIILKEHFAVPDKIVFLYDKNSTDKVITFYQFGANMIYKVSNLFRTTPNPCKCCDTWLDHWKNNAHSDNPVCAYDDCNNPATSGSHVSRECGDAFWYIIPLCDEHAKIRKSFDIKGKLVKIQKLKGCERTTNQ
jgi:hypothetical protein